MDRREARRITSAAFLGRWEEVSPLSLVNKLKGEFLPQNPEKGSVHYDLKKSPEKYVEFTKKICHALGEKGKTCFLPSRRSWVPCHCKVDTEGALEMFTPYSERVKLRKSFGKEDRKAFNDAVWEEILDSKKVAKKSKSFKFHHEISTDGVSALFETKAFFLKENFLF